MGIIAQETPVVRKGIRKEETYNYYGGASREVGINKSITRPLAAYRALSNDVLSDGVCIDGMYAYTTKQSIDSTSYKDGIIFG